MLLDTSYGGSFHGEEPEISDEYMDSDTKSKYYEIIAKNPEYIKELDDFVRKHPEFLHMSDLFRQLIETKYLMTIKKVTEDNARSIAQANEAGRVEEKNLNELDLKAKLTAKLNEAFTNGVLVKNCEKGSNPIFGKTKKDCCDSICKKIDNLVNELEEILKQYGIDSLGNKTIAEVVPSLTGKFTVGDKENNIFKYFKHCKEEKKIDDTKYSRVRLQVELLSFFLGIPSEQEGGYYNTKSRTSKKSRKSRGRGRRHRRSSHNKKRHTKRHTKRYRKRK
jgi:hypothetical protein